MMKQISYFMGILGVSVILLSGCTDHSKPNVELIQDMMENPAVKAQEYDGNSNGQIGLRVPPDHTVPQGFTPYKCSKDIECATGNVNPIAGKDDTETLLLGQKFYDTNCASCHGFKGLGDGQVNLKLVAKPAPPLVSDKIKGWTDGQIYHVISEGQGMMLSYASHVPQDKNTRWAVVNYIRSFQKK